MSSPRTGFSPTSFASVSALTKQGEGRFGAELSPEWTIGDKPNGGYLLSILGRAAVSLSSHGDVVAASAHYLRAPEPGPATVDVDVLREGRSASHVRARMGQGDKVCVEALMTTSDLEESTLVHWDDGLPGFHPVAYDDCVRMVPQAQNGVEVKIMHQIEVRLEPDSGGFTIGEPSGRGELRGWLALPNDASFDPLSLLFAVDAFPPASFDIEFTGWVPTFELTAYVRARPAPGPVHVLQRVQLIAGDRFDESCYVWDSAGALVAQSTQLAGIRLDRP